MLHTLTRPGTVLTLAATLGLLPSAALAETAAGNDHLDGATVITSLPYPEPGAESVDTSGATGSAEDPQTCGWRGGYSVWYSLTAPEDGTLRVSGSASVTFSEDPDDPNELPQTKPIATGVAVFTGGPGGLVELGCQLTPPFPPPAAEGGVVDVAVTAGQRLWVLAGSTGSDSAGTSLSLSIRYLPEVTVAVGPLATVDADGTATLHVITTCVRADSATVDVTLMQGGGRPFGGATTMTVACSPQASSTSIEVAGQGRSFHPGLADYEVSASAGEFDPVTAAASGSLKLRRS